MKKHNAIKIIILFAVIAALLFAFNEVLQPKEQDMYLIDYIYKLPNDTLDVLIFGSSHVYSGINNPLMNEILEADTLSYTAGSNKIEYVQFQYAEAMKTQSPKFVIIELFTFMPYVEGDSAEEVVGHRVFDRMRLSPNKVKGVSTFNFEKPLDFYVPFFKYHERWKSLEESFVFDADKIVADYGFVSYAHLTKKNRLDGSDVTKLRTQLDTDAIDMDRVDILTGIIKQCKDNGQIPILVFTPYYSGYDFVTDDIQNYLLYFDAYSAENNIDYINYADMYDELGFVYTDFRNRTHLNIAGAQKLSEHLSYYIKDKYSDELASCQWDYKAESQQKYAVLDKIHQEYLDSIK